MDQRLQAQFQITVFTQHLAFKAVTERQTSYGTTREKQFCLCQFTSNALNQRLLISCICKIYHYRDTSYPYV